MIVLLYSPQNNAITEIDMPAHYAISEAFITLAALWCAWKLFGRGQWMGAIGSLLFGAAAAIGIYRFPSGQVEELAHIHRVAGQMGGLIGMALITSEILRLAVPSNMRKSVRLACVAAIGICLFVALGKPPLSVPLFLIWSVLAIGAAFSLRPNSISKRIIFAACTGAMLVNVIFIRQSDLMDAHLSWHLFHTLVALWLIAVCVLPLRHRIRNNYTTN